MNTPKSTFRVLVGVLAVFAVICLSIVSVGWFYVLQMSDEVSVLSTETLNMRQESSKLSELSIRYQRVLPQKNLVYGAIPTSKDVSTFMADLESTAKSHGLSINSSVVGNTQTKATKNGDFSQTVNRQEYYELPIRYEVSGNYADFTSFISDLSNLRRLNSVNDIAVTADMSNKAVFGKVKAIFNVTVYAKK